MSFSRIFPLYLTSRQFSNFSSKSPAIEFFKNLKAGAKLNKEEYSVITNNELLKLAFEYGHNRKDIFKNINPGSFQESASIEGVLSTTKICRENGIDTIDALTKFKAFTYLVTLKDVVNFIENNRFSKETRFRLLEKMVLDGKFKTLVNTLDDIEYLRKSIYIPSKLMAIILSQMSVDVFLGPDEVFTSLLNLINFNEHLPDDLRKKIDIKMKCAIDYMKDNKGEVTQKNKDRAAIICEWAKKSGGNNYYLFKMVFRQYYMDSYTFDDFIDMSKKGNKDIFSDEYIKKLMIENVVTLDKLEMLICPSPRNAYLIHDIVNIVGQLHINKMIQTPSNLARYASNLDEFDMPRYTSRELCHHIVSSPSSLIDFLTAPNYCEEMLRLFDPQHLADTYADANKEEKEKLQPIMQCRKVAAAVKLYSDVEKAYNYSIFSSRSISSVEKAASKLNNTCTFSEDTSGIAPRR